MKTFDWAKFIATLQAIAATTPAPVTARPSVRRWGQ